LQDVPQGFLSIDRKLMAALIVMTEKSRGDVLRLITNAQEEAARKGRIMRGLEALRIVTKTFVTSSHTSLQSSLSDLVMLPPGKDLEVFINLYRSQLQSIDESITQPVLLNILHEKLETFPTFSQTLSRFDEKKRAKRTLGNLMKRVDRFLKRIREQNNRQALYKAYGVAQLKAGTGGLAFPGFGGGCGPPKPPGRPPPPNPPKSNADGSGTGAGGGKGGGGDD
jgi:hypothetical protein